MDLNPRTWQTWTRKREFPLKLGGSLPELTLAYETWGDLNASGGKTLVILHALSGSSHARSSATHPLRGWWEPFLGEGGPVGPNRYFTVCANLLGGCYGSTGPGSLDPRSGKPYRLGFPPIAIDDMVDSFRLLLEELGVRGGLTLLGGSMGGMLVLNWAARFPGEVQNGVAFAAPAKSYAQTIAFRAVQREAIMNDPDWKDGCYDRSRPPKKGLALARKIGIITYRSDREFKERFRRDARDARPHFLEGKFEVQSYLDHQGQKFVKRFDPNTYLYFSRAMDLYDLGEGRGSLAEALSGIEARMVLFAFETDFLCPSYQVEEVHRALVTNGQDSHYCLIPTVHGHDAFLIEIESMHRELARLLK